jgi:D-alanyl-D-alanine carboxypeptidase (penicillin-binding protein 5/6)
MLATRLMRTFPEYVGYYAVKKYRYEGTPAANDTNRNLLLFRDPSVDGLKTGHTEAAGYCLIATAKRDFPNVGAPAAGRAGCCPSCWARPARMPAPTNPRSC